MNDIHASSTHNLLILRGLEGNEPASYSDVQEFLHTYYDMATAFWWGTLFFTVCVLATRVYREWRKGSA